MRREKLFLLHISCMSGSACTVAGSLVEMICDDFCRPPQHVYEPSFTLPPYPQHPDEENPLHAKSRALLSPPLLHSSSPLVGWADTRAQHHGFFSQQSWPKVGTVSSCLGFRGPPVRGPRCVVRRPFPRVSRVDGKFLSMSKRGWARSSCLLVADG